MATTAKTQLSSTALTFTNADLTTASIGVSGNAIVIPAIINKTIGGSAYATEEYVTQKLDGLHVKKSCRVKTGSDWIIVPDITTFVVIDNETFGNDRLSFTWAVGDRILIDQSSNLTQNGIYEVYHDGLGLKLQRTADADAGSSATAIFTFVEEGDYAEQGWVCTADSGVEFGHDIEFTTFVGASGTSGNDGAPGKDGTNGTNGTDGADGKDGEDGEDSPFTGVDSTSGLTISSGVLGIDFSSVDITCSSVTTTSDQTLKDNIVAFDDQKALEAVNQMTAHHFVMKAAPETPRCGVIAQEIAEVAPELVHKTEEGTLSVNYGDLTAYLISANKALLARIEALENKA